MIMSDKAPPKSAYKYYTEEQIKTSEEGHYVIQVGPDFYSSETGKMGFSKERVEQLFETVIIGLYEMKQHGTDQECADADKCLLNLRIMPLKIH